MGTEDAPEVWVVEDLRSGRGTARRRPVTLGGAEESGWRELRDGVLPGTKVILDGRELDQGDVVMVQGSEA